MVLQICQKRRSYIDTDMISDLGLTKIHHISRHDVIMGKLRGFYCILREKKSSWCRHQMKTFSALLAHCVGNLPVTGEFPAQKPVTRSFDVFFHLHLNKRLSKQSWGWWFKTPSRSLWRHCNVMLQGHRNVLWNWHASQTQGLLAWLHWCRRRAYENSDCLFNSFLGLITKKH